MSNTGEIHLSAINGADLTVTGRTVEIAIDAHLMSVRLSTRDTGGTGAPPPP